MRLGSLDQKEGMMRLPALGALGAILLLTACQAGTYFPHSDETMTGVPALPGQDVYIGLTDLVAPRDKSVSLISLSVPGLPPEVQAEPFVFHRAQTGGGGVGAVRGNDWGELDSDLLQPLKGYLLEPGRRDPIQLVLRVSAPSSVAVVAFHKVALTFGVEGESQRTEEFSNGAKIWYCSTASNCPEPSAEPTPFTPTTSQGMTAK
jgi:hypothetical protein